MHFTSSAKPASYVVIDLEFMFDRAAHARYMETQQDGADLAVTWAFKRVVAAAAMALTITDHGGARRLEVERFTTWGRPEQDEAGIVAALFVFLQERPASVLTTWSGEYRDVPVLRAAALEHGLRLPAQLEAGVPYLRQTRRHLDLAITCRGQAERVHLAEYAIRVNVPAKLAMRPHEVGFAAERGRWSEVKAQVESDVVTTALLCGRYLYATGEADGGALGTDAAIAGAVIGTHTHRSFADDLRRWLDGRTAAAMRQAWADHAVLAA